MQSALLFDDAPVVEVAPVTKPGRILKPKHHSPSGPDAPARTEDPRTSHAAATSVLPKIGKRQQQVLDVLADFPDGLTSQGIALCLSLPRDSISPRMKAMCSAGRVKANGTRKAERGIESTVWILRAPDDPEPIRNVMSHSEALQEELARCQRKLEKCKSMLPHDKRLQFNRWCEVVITYTDGTELEA